jgi:23S rRNA (cytosine1962-C5)-methyltransferase
MDGPAVAPAAAIALKPGREKSLLAGHPWIFSGAIARADNAAPGDTVNVYGADGTALARAAWSPTSQIRARTWTFDVNEPIDAAFFRRRTEAALAVRAGLLDGDHTAMRLVHGESDGLPGLIVDRYGDVLVVQLLAAGVERHRETIIDVLTEITGVGVVVERSDAEVRTLEGLAQRTGVLRGALDGPVAMREMGLTYRVDVLTGQKTGFYLDQRDNRRIVSAQAQGRRVLNAFCYTGGFSLATLAGNAATVLSLDSSAPALELARANLAANPDLDASRAEWREADVFTELRALRNQQAAFDMIILDPPKFAPTAAHAERAARAYKDINLLAFKLLAPGGLLATFSCSGGIGSDLFQKIVAGAAVDARAQATIVSRLSATRDHPVTLAFPEGEYLKGLLLRKH